MTYLLYYGKIVHMSRLEILGNNIKIARESKGWSQALLAEKLDLSTEYICRVERGQKYMSLRKLFELADFLEIEFSKLTDFK